MSILLIIYLASLGVMGLGCVGALYKEWKKRNNVTFVDVFSAMILSTVPVLNTLVLTWIVLHLGLVVMKDVVLVKGRKL